MQDGANEIAEQMTQTGQEAAGAGSGEGATQAEDQGPDIQVGGGEPIYRQGDTVLDVADNVWHYELLRVSGNTVQVSNIVIALVILALGYGLSRLTARYVGRRWLPKLRLDQSATHTIQSLLFYVLLTIVLLTSLSLAGVPLTALAFLGGAVALGVGFGSQNVINNFISGLILLIERPIKVGELVTVDEQMGTILHIGARATQIHSYMGATYFVPNSTILENSVTNWNRPERKLKSIVSVGVAYGSDTGRVRELLEQAMSEQQLVSASGDNRVMFVDFGSSSLDFEIHCWIHPRNVLEQKSYESDLRLRIDELFRENGIEIPFPQRDMNFDPGRPLSVRIAQEEAPGD